MYSGQIRLFSMKPGNCCILHIPECYIDEASFMPTYE